jgi:hypothetical protein
MPPVPERQSPDTQPEKNFDANKAVAKLEQLKKNFDEEFVKSQETGDYVQTLALKKQIEDEFSLLKENLEAQRAVTSGRTDQEAAIPLTQEQIRIRERGEKFDLTVSGKTGEEYLKMLNSAIFVGALEITPEAHDLFGKATFLPGTRFHQIKLLMVPVKELEIGGTAIPIEKVYQRARELGLETVPADIGPMLYHRYSSDIPQKDVIIGMEPVEVAKNLPNVGSQVFRFKRSITTTYKGGLQSRVVMDVSAAGPGAKLRAEQYIVFGLPAQETKRPA